MHHGLPTPLGTQFCALGQQSAFELHACPPQLAGADADAETGLSVTDAEALTVTETVAVVDAELEAETERDTVALGDALAETDVVAATLGDTDGDTEGLSVTDGVAVMLAVT